MLLFFLALVTLAQENEPVTEAAEAQQAAPGSILANMGTAFTYQGSLVDDSNPADGIYDFQFSLFDAVTVGNQISVTQAVDDIGVSDGLFTVGLDFGADAFNGQARWLEIAVKRDAEGSYTTLTPRTAVTPAPYALALPGLWTQQNATSPNLIGGYAGNVMGTGIYGGTIAGGGDNGLTNRVYDNNGTVSGGIGNEVGIDDGNSNNQKDATVGGGRGNKAKDTYTTIGGGQFNNASAINTTIGGGQNNAANGSGATVSGGRFNIADGSQSTVGGGSYNLAEADYATIAGGGPSDTANSSTTNNRVYDNYGTIGGGGDNVTGFNDGDTTNHDFATVGEGIRTVLLALLRWLVVVSTTLAAANPQQ